MSKPKPEFVQLKLDVEKFFKDKGLPVVVSPDVQANLIAFKKGDETLKPEKFETVTLVDGVTEATIEPAIEAGAAVVFQTTDTEPVAAPPGEYELQDGRVIVITEPGVIAEVREASMGGEGEEGMGGDNPDEPGKVKRIIESIVKEKQFALQSDFEKLKIENEALKKTVSTLTDQSKATDQFIKETFGKMLELVGQEPDNTPVVKGQFRQILTEDENGNPVIKTVKSA